MAEKRKEIVDPIIGEIDQEAVEEANAIAEALLARGKQGVKVRLQSPDGEEIEGTAFRSSDGTDVVVTKKYIAVGDRNGKITHFWPRK